MSRPCARPDDELLRLVHGDLGRTRAWRLRAHLLACPSCRARTQSLSWATRSLALAFTNPRLGTRTFGRQGLVVASVGLTLVLAVVLSLLLSANAARAVAAPLVPTPVRACANRALVAPPAPFFPGMCHPKAETAQLSGPSRAK